MKFLKLILLSVLCVSVFACSSDDDSNDDNNTVAVEGTWQLTSMETETAFDLNMDGTATTSYMEETDCYQNETIVFNADGTGTINSRSFVDIEYDITVGTTDDITWTVDCIDFDEAIAMTWVQNGNQLTITDSDGFDTMVTISGSEFSFVVPKGFYAYDDTTDAEITEDLTFTYTKQ